MKLLGGVGSLLGVRVPIVLLATLSASCVGGGGDESSSAISAQSYSCTGPALTGTPWTPNVVGVSESNHDPDVAIYPSYHELEGNVTGLDQPFALNGPHVFTFTGIPMDVDLLTSGSLTLNAEVSDFPADLRNSGGYAYPTLISLHDGTHELVNVTGCDSGGFFSCPSGTCAPASGCGPKSPSAFLGGSPKLKREHWEQFQQIRTWHYESTNVFPTCNWNGGGGNACAFNSQFFQSGKLKTGTYTAKYVLLTNFRSADINSKYKAKIGLRVYRKKDGDTSGSRGAIDLNVVLVGNKNIEHSRTPKGKQNLDALMAHVRNHFDSENPSTVGIKLGKISVYEWACENGGDAYANISDRLTGELFKKGSMLLDPATSGKAINLFLVSGITSDSVSGTILGLSASIGGAPIHGTSSSGVAVSTLDFLAHFNPGCNPSLASCPLANQSEFFINLGSTITHEIGHFLGLNHPSESGGTDHDWLPDSPECHSVSPAGYITIDSCRAEAQCQAVCSDADYATGFCPSENSCQFNHTMWWTLKNYNSSGLGDANLFSTNAGTILNHSPYVQ